MRVRRSRKMSPTASITAIMLVISVFAIGAGYILSRFLISSFIKQPTDGTPPGSVAVQPGAPTTMSPGSTPTTTVPKDPSTSVPVVTSPKVTPVLPTLPYGQVQVGAFAQEANAENLVRSLQAQGFPATVIHRDLYLVVVGVFADRDTAETYRKALEGAGQKDVHLSSVAVSLTQAKSFQGNEAELVKALVSLIEEATNITAKSLTLADQLYGKRVDQTTWRKEAVNLSSQVTRLEQIQFPNSQGSAMVKEWSGWVGEIKAHLNNNGSRSLTDSSAWPSAQSELMRAITRLQAIYSLLSAS